MSEFWSKINITESNMLKYRIGLDVGPGSVGWAVLEYEIIDGKWYFKRIVKDGSRIIPMDTSAMNNYMTGQSVTRTADRRKKRSIRTMYHRSEDRRCRLLRVLSLMDFLPTHYKEHVNKYGKFTVFPEPLLAWKQTEGKRLSFIFEKSYQEMLAEIGTKHPELVASGKLVPHNWTIYYLRKKALEQPISRQELAWILLQANQKRGYNSSRAADADTGDADKTKAKSKEMTVFKEVKLATEMTIKESGKTVGAYIYEQILLNPDVKVKGALVQTIDRPYYRKEIQQILEFQSQFLPELKSKELLTRCADHLYPTNEAHRERLKKKSLIHLLVDDILYYQRPLKTKKSLIADCPMESYVVKDRETGEEKKYSAKCIARSNPLFQEFRIWQIASNLCVYRKELEEDVDVTNELFPAGDFQEQFFAFSQMEDLFNAKKSPTANAVQKRSTLTEADFLQKFCKIKKNLVGNYKWNYPSDTVLKLNETRSIILAALLKSHVPARGLLDILSSKHKGVTLEELIWNILYSQDDPSACEKSLRKLLGGFHLEHADEMAIALAQSKPFANDYGSFSAKAIKKMLPLMRTGKYWSAETISAEVKERIEHVLTGEVDSQLTDLVREKFPRDIYRTLEDFSGVPLWRVSYLVYGRHSEARECFHWKNPDDITEYIKRFKQHSLHNPIVETAVLETLRVCRDLMKEFAVSQIHLEVARDLNASAKERKRMSEISNRNAKRRLRAIAMIRMIRDTNNKKLKCACAIPESPTQIEKMIIYEDQVLGTKREGLSEDETALLKKMQYFSRISTEGNDKGDTNKKDVVTSKDIEQYLLWINESYVSPYTGEPIQLSELFTEKYEIEHILPRSKWSDNSLHNKVLAEKAVNGEKSDLTGLEFIRKQGGKIINLGENRFVTVRSEAAYQSWVEEYLGYDRMKQKNLLMLSVPSTFTSRNLNETRYISRMLSHLLSNLVRDEEDDFQTVSKNLLVIQGGITSRLKIDWGLHAVWNELMLPRFERMNQLQKSHEFIEVTPKGHRIPAVPLENRETFELKRIDHRHHALDAIIIASTERAVVQYLNTKNALEEQVGGGNYYALRNSVCRRKENDEIGDRWIVKKPTENQKFTDFCDQVKQALQNCQVSFKYELRTVLMKRDPKSKKRFPGVCMQLHDEKIFGEIQLQEGCEKAIAYVIRRPVDESFNERIIESVSNKGVRQILRNHLRSSQNAKDAFGPEGLKRMNSNLQNLNGGSCHKPIYRVRVCQKMGQQAIGFSEFAKMKFAKAASGTNLYMAIYEGTERNQKRGEVIVRKFKTISLRDVMEARQKGVDPIPKELSGLSLLDVLAVGDLVYMPREGESADSISVDNIDRNRIYKMVSTAQDRAMFIPHYVACSIIDKQEFTTNNKMPVDLEQRNILQYCVKINVDRLGNLESRNKK